MVYQQMALDLPYHIVAMNLGVDASTVCRILQLFNQTGTVKKKAYDNVNLNRKLTDIVQFFILQLLDRPGIYLHEIQIEVKYILGLELSPSMLC